MRIRLYVPEFPFPPTQGAFQIITDQIHTFIQQGHSLELVLIRETPTTLHQKLQTLHTPLKITYFCLRHPSRPLPHKSIRILQSLLHPAFCSTERFFYPPSLSARTILTQPVDLAIYHYSFAYLWLSQPTTVQEMKKIVYCHNREHELQDIHALQLATQKQAPHHKFLQWIYKKNARCLEDHEKKLSLVCDEIWNTSLKEHQDYQNFKKENPATQSAQLRFTPPTFPSSLREERNQALIHSASPCFGFIGGMDFIPNLLSASWILQWVAPILKKQHFSGQLLFAGKPPKPDLLQMAQDYPFVHFLGFLKYPEEIEAFWRKISWLLIPHQAGSGVRIKLLEAIASGIPVLTNAAALHSLDPEIQTCPWIQQEETPEAWAHILLDQCKQPSFQKRNELLHHPLPTCLSGENVYSFLSQCPSAQKSR